MGMVAQGAPRDCAAELARAGAGEAYQSLSRRLWGVVGATSALVSEGSVGVGVTAVCGGYEGVCG